jgi:hypothetical protein
MIADAAVEAEPCADPEGRREVAAEFGLGLVAQV